ncbi:oocyte zinc finger protein XlCOF6 [Esox lucius]|uniref:C2H2-type domain-containing protein n=1 Tax=Esox lucius TaxID=8010 RepID=A0A3P9AE68_ESOLU|nr:oocyte zinc finger protein XlCOF6 [Esox lucius]
MSKQQSFSVSISKRLTTAAVDIFGVVEKSVLEYQEENNRLRRILGIAPEINIICAKESLQEQEELRTSQEEEHLQGIFNTEDYRCIPPIDQEDPVQEAILANYPTLSPLKVSKLQSFCVFLNKCLTVSTAVEILKAVEKTVAEYQEENDQLRRLQQKTPEIKLYRIDALQFSLTVSEEEVPLEHQHCKQEWSPSLGDEDPQTKQIKVEPEELRTCEEEEQHSSALNSDPVGLDSIPPVDPSTTPRKTHAYPDSGKTIALKADLNRNLIVAKNGNNECIFCQKQYSSPRQLKAHVRKSHTEESCNCPICGKTIKRKIYLSQHMRIHTGEKQFSCKDCGKSYFRKNHLNRHLISCTQNKSLSCAECGRRFASMSNLNQHKQIHIRQRPCTSGDGGKCFKDEKTLSRHKPTHILGKPFSCGECRKSFCFRSSLDHHQLIHTGEKIFSSVQCGKGVGFKSNLNQHDTLHTGENTCNCVECRKNFILKSSLNKHKPLHAGEKRFRCECGKSFGQKKHLTKHERTHTGEKPFTCGECGKSFGRKDHLTKHERTHTGQKTIRCGDCGKSFGRKDHLIKHEQTHTEQKPISCDVCGKGFSEKSFLTTHKLTHTGESQGSQIF